MKRLRGERGQAACRSAARGGRALAQAEPRQSAYLPVGPTVPHPGSLAFPNLQKKKLRLGKIQ